MPSQPGAIQVTDRLERRIRKPIDLLRCVTSGIEIIVLAVAGVAASATTTGVETDIVGASSAAAAPCCVVAPPLVLFAILIVPVALAVRQLVRRQVQRLAEAVATGVLAAAVAAVLNAALQREVAARLYDAIIMSRPGASHAAALDPYLAGAGRLRDDHRPVRPAGLAERPVAGRRRLRARPPGATWTRPSSRSCSRCSSGARSASASGTWRAARRCVPARRRSRPR